jgi:hypothetical protein
MLDWSKALSQHRLYRAIPGLLEFEQERPHGFLGEGWSRLGLRQRDYGERHLEGG